ncbi:MAG: hypothetical protein K2O76_01020 [Mailhella sp.]|nr:hypothetical protein [Mailhella sp.]
MANKTDKTNKNFKTIGAQAILLPIQKRRRIIREHPITKPFLNAPILMKLILKLVLKRQDNSHHTHCPRRKISAADIFSIFLSRILPYSA